MPELETLLDGNLAEHARDRLRSGMSGLKERAKNITELAEISQFYASNRPLKISGKAQKILDDDALSILKTARSELNDLTDWSSETVENTARAIAEADDLKFGKIAQPLRAALSGSTASPGIFEVMVVLGQDETVARLDDILTKH